MKSPRAPRAAWLRKPTAIVQRLLQRVMALLQGMANQRLMPSLCGLLAFGLTASMSVPVTAMLVPAVLLAPRHWRSIALQSAFGSAIGATLLVELFHDLGWAQVYQLFPSMLDSDTWQQVLAWVGEYGVIALFFVAALPLPQTPALLFCALTRQPLLEVLAAVLLGKLLKYGLTAWLSLHFPGTLRRWINRASRSRPDSLHR